MRTPQSNSAYELPAPLKISPMPEEMPDEMGERHIEHHLQPWGSLENGTIDPTVFDQPLFMDDNPWSDLDSTVSVSCSPTDGNSFGLQGNQPVPQTSSFHGKAAQSDSTTNQLLPSIGQNDGCELVEFTTEQLWLHAVYVSSRVILSTSRRERHMSPFCMRFSMDDRAVSQSMDEDDKYWAYWSPLSTRSMHNPSSTAQG